MIQSLDRAQVDRIKPFLPARLAESLVTIPTDSSRQDEIATALSALRQGISAYLPRYLIDVLNENPVPGQAGCDFKSGTLMFADVSGFTAMSEKLSVLGKEGAEEMTGIVNAYFEAMLDISEDMGGDLLKFGGDALMIFFEGDQGASRALGTAWSMQAAMSQFTDVETSQGVFPLQMSIGMASGPLILLNLGTAEEMYYTVMGRTLGRMAQMEGLATAGQIVLDDETAQHLGEQVQVEQVDEGAFLLKGTKLEVPDEPASISSVDSPIVSLSDELALVEAISPYIPQELLERLISDPDHPVRRGSHRPVTNMFANFIGLDEIVEDLGPERRETILAIAAAYFDPMSQILDRYGGTISRLDNYTQGQRILALFGALQAHEDDPERAVRAGIEMNHALASVNQEIQLILSAIDLESGKLTQRIGINTGFVFAGSVGSPRRREYTVMGAQVNLTARLMSIARVGDVLIGGSTSRHVERSYDLAEQESVKVKGISDPVRNFIVGDEKGKQTRVKRVAGAPIHGREQELVESRGVMRDVLEGQGRTLVISGDSGIGKSRLVEEIVGEAMVTGLDVVDGACLSYGRTMTYHPWAEILRALFGFTTDQSPQDRIRTLTLHMEAIEQGLFTPLIGQVMGLPVEDNDLTRDLDAKLRRQRVLDLVLQLLQSRATERPLLVLIEDAHWADDASRDLINYVGRNIGSNSIFLLLSHRPDEGLPAWQELPGGQGLALGGLSAEACLALARQILEGQPLSERLEAFVLEKGEGNPLFLGEVIRNLLDAGSVVQDADGVWDLPEGSEAVELPDTIHGMIISRMDRLAPADRRMLQVAAVVGRSFSTPTLVGVYAFDLATADITQRIGMMADKGLVELMEAGEQLFRFTHLTTQEVVYESLSYELRRDLHRRIGTHYEETHVDGLEEWIDLLAYHYFEGQAWPKAATYNLQAGQRAQREYANQAAIGSCQKVLAAAEKLEVDEQIQFALPAHEVIGDVSALTGKYEDAIENFSQALSLVDEALTGDDQLISQASFHRKIAEVYEKRSEFDVAFDWLGRGLAYLSKTGPSLVGAQAKMLGAGIYRRLGKFEDAIQWCQDSLEIAAKIDSREGAKAVAHANYSMSGIYWRLGDLEKALTLAAESLSQYESIEDPLGQARAYNNLSNAYADLGDWDQAIDAMEKSLAINERTGDIVTRGIVTNNIGLIKLDRGEWEEAYELFHTSREIWVRLGAALQEAVLLSNIAQVYINQGNWPEAEASLMDSRHIFETLGSNDYMPEIERRWAELYLRTGNLDSALSHAKQAIELASELEARLDLGLAFRILGEIAIEMKDLEEAEMSLRRSQRILQDLDSEYESAKVALPLAHVAKAQGAELDLDSLDAAMSTFSRLGAKYDQQRIQEFLAGNLN